MFPHGPQTMSQTILNERVFPYPVTALFFANCPKCQQLMNLGVIQKTDKVCVNCPHCDFHEILQDIDNNDFKKNLSNALSGRRE